MSFIDSLFGAVIGSIVGGFSGFLTNRYFFKKVDRLLDKIEGKVKFRKMKGGKNGNT